ncbi:MAG TPA: hypothetical protein VN961_03835 [Streptosporangiaceae bacterium]|nr:hypothetical protein [Streptosporangiaceae bacterium]
MIADSGPVTTAGVIAVGNLNARIDAQLSRATRGRLTVGERAELVELLAQHNLSLRQTPRARALVRRSSGHPPG